MVFSGVQQSVQSRLPDGCEPVGVTGLCQTRRPPVMRLFKSRVGVPDFAPDKTTKNALVVQRKKFNVWFMCAHSCTTLQYHHQTQFEQN